METKFIEGTNEQYSIREDGAVIRNYKFKGRKEYGHIVYESTIMSYKRNTRRNCKHIVVRSNNCTFTWYKNSLLAKYFNFIICPRCKEKIKTTKHIKVCKKCVKEKQYNSIMKWRFNNKDIVLNSQKKSYLKYKDKYRKSANERVKNLHSNYVASKLKIPISLLPSEIIEAKRTQLKLHREWKNLNY